MWIFRRSSRQVSTELHDPKREMIPDSGETPGPLAIAALFALHPTRCEGGVSAASVPRLN